MFRENDINKFLNGRQFFILTAVLFVILTWVATGFGCSNPQSGTPGVCLSSQSVLRLSPVVSLLLNLCGFIGVCALMSLLNKAYTFTRDVTYVFASAFMLLGIAVPDIAVQLYDGTMLCFMCLFMVALLFGLYQSPYPQRRVFLISLLLSACCMYSYAFMYLIPVFFVGFLQMRSMSVRSALAMVLGLVTPFWIVLGMGIMEISELMLPRWENIWNGIDMERSGFFVGVVAVTAIVTVIMLARNILQIINYKMQVRAYNGFFLVLTVATMVVMVVDYTNLLVYLPMLNVCFAIQMAHAFTIKKYLRRYILYFSFAAVCIGVYVWRVFY